MIKDIGRVGSVLLGPGRSGRRTDPWGSGGGTQTLPGPGGPAGDRGVPGEPLPARGLSGVSARQRVLGPLSGQTRAIPGSCPQVFGKAGREAYRIPAEPKGWNDA